MKKKMIGTVVAIVAALQIPASAQLTPASATADVMAVVRQFVDGFNKGDLKMLLAACAEEPSIIDDFPPHEWHGAGACARWSSDYDADARKNGITDGFVSIGKPFHVDVTGDRAYIVGPADYVYKLKGKPVKEIGSVFTLTLQDGSAGWRITGWSWAKR